MNKPLLIILLIIDYIWLKSSFGKLTEGKFVGSLGQTLTKMAGNNPYPPVKDFLQNVAIPNADTFGNLTMYGETGVAVSILICAALLLFTKNQNKILFTVLLAGLFVGMFLNMVFWLSSGWSSSASESLNMLMFAVEAVGFLVFLKSFRKTAA